MREYRSLILLVLFLLAVMGVSLLLVEWSYSRIEAACASEGYGVKIIGRYAYVCIDADTGQIFEVPE